MVFVKGQSGNVNGRPRGLTARDFITDEDLQVAMQKLKAFTNDSRKEIAFKALELYIAYGFGKPTQQIEHQGKVALLIDE